MGFKLYIGLVGPIAAGKMVFSDYLEENYSFTRISLSLFVHQERERRGIKVFTRDTLQQIGDELRQKFGPQVLADKAIEFLKNQGEEKMIIDGIRHPSEVKTLKKLPHFVLVGINAKKIVRFKRVLKRNKPWDPKTWEEFLKVNRRDLGVGKRGVHQQVKKCLKLVDYHLTNNASLKTFICKVETLMTELEPIQSTWTV